MRILLDAKDLIDVLEHSKPVTVSELDSWLRKRSDSVVYSLCNIRGLAGPIGMNESHLPQVREYIDWLEYLPHCYIGTDIDLMELRAALRCFEAGREYEPIDPYVPRFDQVFPPFANSNKVNYPLCDIVHDLWKACPQIFGPQTKAHKLQTVAMSMDRGKPQTRSPRPVEPPSESIREYLMLKMSVTPERAAEVASWVAASPFRCPGLWLVRTVGSAMSQNRSYLARKDDTFDLAEIVAFPYVDAATVDRTMLDYFSRAMRSLSRTRSPSEQTLRVFRKLQDLMEASS